MINEVIDACKRTDTSVKAARDSLMGELEEILAGGLSGTKLFLVHGNGRAE